jgi:hypothetical protein
VRIIQTTQATWITTKAYTELERLQHGQLNTSAIQFDLKELIGITTGSVREERVVSTWQWIQSRLKVEVVFSDRVLYVACEGWGPFGAAAAGRTGQK